MGLRFSRVSVFFVFGFISLLPAQTSTIAITVKGIVTSGTDGNPDSNPPGAGKVFGGGSDLSGEPFTLTLQISDSEGTPNTPGKCSDGVIYSSAITGSGTSAPPQARLEIGNSGSSFTYGALSLSSIGWIMVRTARTSCTGGSTSNSITLGWSEYEQSTSGDYGGGGGFGSVVLYTQNDISPGLWYTPVPEQPVTSGALQFTFTINQASNIYNNLKVARGNLQPQSVSVSGPPSSCDVCTRIANQSKSAAGQAESLQLCHELLGALSELGRYRSAFLENVDFVNLFPTAYYDVTSLEMQRIAAGTYKYPIEKMQQMLAFFDAYKSNRDLWNLGATPEPHWAAYYTSAQNANRLSAVLVIVSKLPYIGPYVDILRALGLQTAFGAQQVMEAGIHAHVDIDFPRALRYSFGTEFDTSASPNDLLIDFVGTNGTLDQSAPTIFNDIFAATETLGLLPPLVDFFSNPLPDDISDIISRRLQAWNTAVSSTALGGIDGKPLGPQPLTDHAALESEGALTCGTLVDP